MRYHGTGAKRKRPDNNKLTIMQEDQLQFAKGIAWCKEGNAIEANVAYDSKFLDGYAYQYELEAKQSSLNSMSNNLVGINK